MINIDYIALIEKLQNVLQESKVNEYLKLRDLLTEKMQDKSLDNFPLEYCFLLEILKRKMNNGISQRDALSNIYGVEIDQSNIDECKRRLLMGNNRLRKIVDKNIICADTFKYNFDFDEEEKFGNDLFSISNK